MTEQEARDIINKIKEQVNKNQDIIEHFIYGDPMSEDELAHLNRIVSDTFLARFFTDSNIEKTDDQIVAEQEIANDKSNYVPGQFVLPKKVIEDILGRAKSLKQAEIMKINNGIFPGSPKAYFTYIKSYMRVSLYVLLFLFIKLAYNKEFVKRLKVRACYHDLYFLKDRIKPIEFGYIHFEDAAAGARDLLLEEADNIVELCDIALANFKEKVNNFRVFSIIKSIVPGITTLFTRFAIKAPSELKRYALDTAFMDEMSAADAQQDLNKRFLKELKGIENI